MSEEEEEPPTDYRYYALKWAVQFAGPAGITHENSVLKIADQFYQFLIKEDKTNG